MTNKTIKKYDFTSIEDATKKTSIQFKNKIEVFENVDQQISNIRNELRDTLFTYVEYARTQSKVAEEIETYSKENLYKLCLEFIGKTNKEIATTNIRAILNVVCKSVVLLLDKKTDDEIKVELFNQGKTETKVSRVKSNPNNKDKDLVYRSVKGDLMVEYNYFKPTFKVNDKDLGMEVVKDNLDDTQIPMNDVMINKLYAKLHSTGRTPSTEVDSDDDNKTAHELIIEWNNYLSEWINDDDMLAECNSDIEFKKEYARLQVHINQMNTEMLRVSNEDSKVEGIKINPKALEKSA
tara:strand:+ start:379 stop:1260 length:882 start_codon:yes stop_codon:yes gene_type:complete